MSEDRTLFWGTEGEHNYVSGEGGSGPPDGNFVVAETDAGTRLFEWDGTQWVSRGAVNMDGNDMEEVGSLTAESASIGEPSKQISQVKTEIAREDNPSGESFSINLPEALDEDGQRATIEFRNLATDTTADLEISYNDDANFEMIEMRYVDGTSSTSPDRFDGFQNINTQGITGELSLEHATAARYVLYGPLRGMRDTTPENSFHYGFGRPQDDQGSPTTLDTINLFAVGDGEFNGGEVIVYEVSNV